MASAVELTLGDVARIALGNSDFGPYNRALLHGLMDILLKKLDCHNEKVQLGDYNSNSLKKMLPNSNDNPFIFNENHFDIIPKKLKRIKELEKRVDILHKGIKMGFAFLGECNPIGIFDNDNWEQYATMCEDLCIIPEPENVSSCKAITNSNFIHGMFRITSLPLVNRMLEFELRTEFMHRDFQSFLKRIEEQYLEIGPVEMCVPEIEYLRKEIQDEHLKFLHTVDQMREMFLIKLDKIHLAAMKKYLLGRFEEMELELHAMNGPIRCPKARGMIMNCNRCLSCGMEKSANQKRVHLENLLSEDLTRIEPKILKKYCNCLTQSHMSIHQHQDTPAVPVGIVNIELKSAHSRPSTSTECPTKKRKEKKRSIILNKKSKDKKMVTQEASDPVSFKITNTKPSALHRASDGAKRKKESTFSLSFDK